MFARLSRSLTAMNPLKKLSSANLKDIPNRIKNVPRSTRQVLGGSTIIMGASGFLFTKEKQRELAEKDALIQRQRVVLVNAVEAADRKATREKKIIKVVELCSDDALKNNFQKSFKTKQLEMLSEMGLKSESQQKGLLLFIDFMSSICKNPFNLDFTRSAEMDVGLFDSIAEPFCTKHFNENINQAAMNLLNDVAMIGGNVDSRGLDENGIPLEITFSVLQKAASLLEMADKVDVKNESPRDGSYKLAYAIVNDLLQKICQQNKSNIFPTSEEEPGFTARYKP